MDCILLFEYPDRCGNSNTLRVSYSLENRLSANTREAATARLPTKSNTEVCEDTGGMLSFLIAETVLRTSASGVEHGLDSQSSTGFSGVVLLDGIDFFCISFFCSRLLL